MIAINSEVETTEIEQSLLRQAAADLDLISLVNSVLKEEESENTGDFYGLYTYFLMLVNDENSTNTLANHKKYLQVTSENKNSTDEFENSAAELAISMLKFFETDSHNSQFETIIRDIKSNFEPDNLQHQLAIDGISDNLNELIYTPEFKVAA